MIVFQEGRTRKSHCIFYQKSILVPLQSNYNYLQLEKKKQKIEKMEKQ